MKRKCQQTLTDRKPQSGAAVILCICSAGIYRHLPKSDRMNCATFKSSNGVFKSVIKNLEKRERCQPAPPSTLTLRKTRERRRGGNRDSTRDSFTVKEDENISLAHNAETKNHKGSKEKKITEEASLLSLTIQTALFPDLRSKS